MYDAWRKPPPGMTVRAAARDRFALSGPDAQALEGALQLTERERDKALADLAAALLEIEELRRY